MTGFAQSQFGHMGPLQIVLWWIYLVAAVAMPIHHVRPILKYLRGTNGIGDACIRTEIIQCSWRAPALLFSIVVTPSLPLFLSIFLDMTGRIGRIVAMEISQRRFIARLARETGTLASLVSPAGVLKKATFQSVRLARALSTAVMALSLVGCASVSWPTASEGDSQHGTGAEDECHPQPNAAMPQYVIGYGSLMQEESRRRTSPNAAPAEPVDVSGFRRGWFAKGNSVGLSTTFLGVVPHSGSHLNAVAYRVAPAELKATDRREVSYCRKRVPAEALTVKVSGPAHRGDSEAWIYVTAPAAIAVPSQRYPIVQSYVDIFVSGCLEQEERFHLQGFARACLATTTDWSAHWVNDRPYPRRPFISQPRSGQIDLLLSQELPDLFSRIRIE